MSTKVYLKIVVGFVAFLIGFAASFSTASLLLANQEPQNNSVYTLGDFVWQDSDQDGYQDPNEQGFPDIRVELFNDALCTVAIIADTETDAAGLYRFTELLPGDYCLKFSNIPAHQIVSPSQHRQGNLPLNGALDSNGVASANRTIAYIPNIKLKKDDPTQDLGLYSQTIEIGDRVWLDDDGDGYQGSDELGVSDISVHLLTPDGTLYQTQITDESGHYLFEGVSPGSYKVQFDLATLPLGYVATTPNAEVVIENDEAAKNDGTADSDANPENGMTDLISFLPNGSQEHDIDMGIYHPINISGRAWLDADGNGLYDETETGIGDIEATLFDSTGSSVAQVQTADNGLYNFEGIPPGAYYVLFNLATLPAKHTVTALDVGTDDLVDNDTMGADTEAPGQTTPTPFMASGATLTGLDIGIVPLLELDGRVWSDDNANGIQNESELGIADVMVNLIHADGTPVQLDSNLAQPRTDSQGFYKFTDLKPGRYYVVFGLNTLAESYVVTVPNRANNDEIDSDVNPSTGKSSIIELINDMQSVDMGVYTLSGVRVGGTVWLDTNANGIQDVAEVGVPDIGVTLFNSAAQPVAQTTSEANGVYLFDALRPGHYYVIFNLETLPAEYYVTQPEANDDDQNHSDADVDSGKTPTTPFLADGVEELSLNMGIYAYASIGDRVWEDANADGIQDESERGIEGVTVHLLDETGQATGKTVTTDADGQFSFMEILPGQYQLEFVVRSEYTITPQNQGNSDAADSDVHPQSRRTAITNLVSGENDPMWDLGLYQSTTVGDRIWLDVDGNGIQNSNESGLAQVTIHLADSAGNILNSTKSDEQGNYLFENLPPGEYQLYCEPPEGLTYTRVGQSTEDSEHPDDSDVDPISRRTSLFTLVPNAQERGWDIGLTEPAEIRSLVWVDRNGNGIKDAIETGIANMVVNLYNRAEELVHTTNTDVTGTYEFTNLTPGGYIVEFLPPSGFAFTSQGEPNGSGNISSGASPLTGRTQIVNLQPSEQKADLAAGIIEDNNNHGPTAVELATFTVSIAEREIMVEWQTTAENETLGFYLYRSTMGERNTAVRLNAAMVVSQGEEGGYYQYSDSSILDGVTYAYWLQEVERDGRTRDYGPVGTHLRSEQGLSSTWHIIFLPLVLHTIPQNN